MTKQQMAQKIKRLKRRIKNLESELQCATGRILPDGWVAHPVDDTGGPSRLTTNADGPCYLDPSGKLVPLVDP